MDEFAVNHNPPDTLHQLLCETAARMIAEDGLDYPSARAYAIKQVCGGARPPKHCMPNDAAIEAALRAYQAEYLSDTQPAELLALRESAARLMRLLLAFEPIVYGACVNGTGSQHSDIHLLAFHDDPKALDYALFELNLPYDAGPDALLGQRRFDAVVLHWEGRLAQVGIGHPHDRRGLLRRNATAPLVFQTDYDGLLRMIET